MYDDLELRSADEREQTLFDDVGLRLSAAANALPGLSAHLTGHDLGSIRSRADLSELPVLRKNILMEAQRRSPPFGGFANHTGLGGSRVFMSPGPVFEPQPPFADPWSGARALHAAGIRPGMHVHNSFSYHLTPGGFILDESARALGCTVFPTSVGSTAMQIEAIRHYRPEVYVGTPNYLRTLIDEARDMGRPLDSLSLGLVSGGALFPAMREAYRADGVSVLQCYATADVGVIAYESASNGNVHAGMLVNEGLIVELCRPGTGEPVEAGERGEVVVTRLDPPSGPIVAPLVRFATGDLSAWLDEPSPCGRTAPRLAGWLGRADQRTKVRGMFVDPEQVQAVRAAFTEIERVRLVVSREDDRDAMTLQVQLAASAVSADREGMAQAVAAELREACGLAGVVSLVPELPADGIVIDDTRDYSDGASV